MNVTGRPQEHLQLIKRVLGDDYIQMEYMEVQTTDGSTDKMAKTTVRAYLKDGDGEPLLIEGTGEGIVGAFFEGILNRFSEEYQSLKTIEISQFRAEALAETKHAESGADAICKVEIEVRNSESRRFYFTDASRSLISASIRCTLAAAEYFINSERAFVKLYVALQDAKERRREDLVARYTAELAEVVKSTSYAEVIARIRSELPG